MINDSLSAADLQTRLIQLAAAQVPMDPSGVSLASRFIEDLGYDSLDVTEFVMEVEDQFGVSLPDEQIERFHMVQDVLDWLNKQPSGAESEVDS